MSKIIQDIKVALGNRIQDNQHCKIKIEQKLSCYNILNYVVIKIIQYIFTILFIVSVKGKNAKAKIDRYSIILIKAEKEYGCDLYNVRKDRFGLPITKCVIPGFNIFKTFIPT